MDFTIEDIERASICHNLFVEKKDYIEKTNKNLESLFRFGILEIYNWLGKRSRPITSVTLDRTILQYGIEYDLDKTEVMEFLNELRGLIKTKYYLEVERPIIKQEIKFAFNENNVVVKMNPFFKYKENFFLVVPTISPLSQSDLLNDHAFRLSCYWMTKTLLTVPYILNFSMVNKKISVDKIQLHPEFLIDIEKDFPKMKNIIDNLPQKRVPYHITCTHCSLEKECKKQRLTPLKKFYKTMQRLEE